MFNDTLAQSALTDATTRLPNRRALMEELRRRLHDHGPSGRALVVAFIDLDRFKAINDVHGHDAGDRFLTAIGGRMQNAVRADDFVARLGGDEFVVLSSPAHDDALLVADAMRKRLQEATSGRFHLGELTLDYAGPSIGSIVSMSGEVDPEALLACQTAERFKLHDRHDETATQAKAPPGQAGQQLQLRDRRSPCVRHFRGWRRALAGAK